MSKIELIHEAAKLVVRMQNHLVNIREKDEKAREGRLQSPEAGKLSWGGGSALFCVTSEVKIIAMAGTSDSKFQLKVRQTFLLDLSKGKPG